MNEVSALYSKINQTKITKLKTFKYIKKEIQKLYKNFEELLEENISDNKIITVKFNDYLMELNNLLQTLDSIHMEICFMDRNYLLYL